MVNRVRRLDPIQNKEIGQWCHKTPQFYGLYGSACQIAGSFMAQARNIQGLVRRELIGTMFRGSGPSRIINNSSVLFDASLGGYHSSLWLPVAESLLLQQFRVGFVYQGSEFPEALKSLKYNSGSSGWDAVCLPDSVLWSMRPRVSLLPKRLIPWRGSFGLSVRLLLRHSSRLAGAWSAILKRSVVQVVVTTMPFSPWSAGLVLAAADLGISTVYLLPAMPGEAQGFPICDTALVSSPLGRKLLRDLGWGEKEIFVAANPTIPLPNERQRLRENWRRQRGLTAKEFLVLVIGQPSCDRGFVVNNYQETWVSVGKGLATACKKNRVGVALRPHQCDCIAETEGILRGNGLNNLVVWRGAPLQEDIACADLVVGMHSMAMEEAFLAGKPVVQVYVGHAEPEVDFRVLGCPLARSAKELTDLIENREWIAARQKPEVWPAPGDIIANILERRRLPK